MNDKPDDERERDAILAQQQMRERAEFIVRDQKGEGLTGPHWARRLRLPAIIVFVLAVLYALIAPPHYSWRQKLTISIMTPRGVVEGAAVTQIDVYDLRSYSLGFPDARGTNSSFTGEAVSIEILPGKVLFVLLGNRSSGSDPISWPASIWYQPQMTFEEYMGRIRQQHGQPEVPLPQNSWPTMATFGDPLQPETLQIIPGPDLAPWFGPGYRVEGMTLQITREAVTEGRIEAFLPWLRPAGFSRGIVASDPAPLISLSAFLSTDHWRRLPHP